MQDECAVSSEFRLIDALALLLDEYGPPPIHAPQAPLDELIMTILSQHTSDTNTARAFAGLRERFDDWEHAAKAPVSDVADAIRSGGLANVKAAVIQRTLRTVFERTGSYDLGNLEGVSDAKALAWLMSLHGVGPKTAACVLLFGMQRAVMPVDTHVHRVSTRLGFIEAGTSAEHAHGQLELRIPAESMYDAHMLLIQHGRVTCKARAPRCRNCVLATHCPSAARFGSHS